ncbi:MAG: hypothetical protein H0W50_09005 [Parachlamydiaceae bacterium]|nr:hypothetical protein [Parachlamydiaceae bacterium]
MILDPTQVSPWQNCLSGENAFYNKENYLEATKEDFSQGKSLPVSYTWNTESKILRIAKLIFSIIIFPVGIYKLIHSLVGKVLLPASSPSRMGLPANYANNARQQVNLNGDWKYKRLTIEVDGYKIDATIMGKEATFDNGRWTLLSNGNGEFAEEGHMASGNFIKILSEVNSNGIVFNYPGVGSSSGLPNREAMAKVYRAMLNFLEDKEKGIGAKEIIGYGHSIGGGAQGDALRTHDLKKNVKYVFVKSRTFSDLSTEASLLVNKPAGFLLKIFGWNMGSVESSKNLKAPEIIMHMPI